MLIEEQKKEEYFLKNYMKLQLVDLINNIVIQIQ